MLITQLDSSRVLDPYQASTLGLSREPPLLWLGGGNLGRTDRTGLHRRSHQPTAQRGLVNAQLAKDRGHRPVRDSVFVERYDTSIVFVARLARTCPDAMRSSATLAFFAAKALTLDRLDDFGASPGHSRSGRNQLSREGHLDWANLCALMSQK